MPRTFDRSPFPVADKDPNRSATDWTDPQGGIDEAARISGELVRQNITRIVKDLTGIDLTGAFEFIDWFGNEVGLAFHNFGAWWTGLIDGIANVFGEITDTVGRTVEDAVASISRVLGVGQNAGLSADHANIGVQSIKAQLAGGGFDEFDYASANILPSSAYDIYTNGPGGGHYGPNGSGYLVWKPSGAQWREVIYRRNDLTLGSDNGVVTVVWGAKPYDPLFSDSYGYICGRMGSSFGTHIRAVIDNNSARIQALSGGTVAQIGPTVSLTIKNGDVFEFWFGTASQPYRMWLVQNGTRVLDVEDTGAVSEIGAAYRRVGIGCYVSNYAVFYQNPAPALAGWTWAVQTVA